MTELKGSPPGTDTGQHGHISDLLESLSMLPKKIGTNANFLYFSGSWNPKNSRNRKEMNIFPKVFEKLYLFLSPKSNIAAVHSKSGVLQGTLGFVRISRIVTYIFRILYTSQFPRKYKIKCSEKSISFHKNQIPVQTEVVIFMGNVSSKGYTVAFRIRNVHLREKIGSTDPFKTRKSLRFYGVSFRLILVPERVQE